MIQTLLKAFQIDMTYQMNAFMYRLKKLPLIGSLIPNWLFAKSEFKKAIFIISFILKVIWGFAKKSLYIGLMIYWPITLMPVSSHHSMMTIFFFLTIFGAFCNSSLLVASSKKYYNVILMHMDAKKYALSHFYFLIISTVITMTPALLLCLPAWYHVMVCLLFWVGMKIIGEAITLWYYLKKDIVLTTHFKFNLLAGILVILAYLFPYLQWNISWGILNIIVVFVTLMSLFAIRYLTNNTKYHLVYKQLITYNKIMFKVDTASIQSEQNNKVMSQQDISLPPAIKNKKGYDYLNSIFSLRHKKILLNSAQKISLILLGIVAVCIGGSLINENIKNMIHTFILTKFPYFVFLMYMINRGSVISQAMFFNCDHSMLAYSFYRRPQTILALFKARLKTIITVNLLPAGIIALSLPILLYVTGSSVNGAVSISVFISILFLSIFFSIHHLVVYYLLQPYDINMTAKSSMYSIVNTITYLACYIIIHITVNTFVFSVGVIVFTIIYMILSLLLVYRLAPKTFKLK